MSLRCAKTIVAARYRSDRTAIGSTRERSACSARRFTPRAMLCTWLMTSGGPSRTAAPDRCVAGSSRDIDRVAWCVPRRRRLAEVAPPAPDAPDRAHQCSEIAGSHLDDPEGGGAHAHGSVDPGHRHLFNVIAGEQRLEARLHVGREVRLLD